MFMPAPGIAVNHLKDWDPNFKQLNLTHQLPLPLPATDDAAAKSVLNSLGVHEQRVKCIAPVNSNSTWCSISGPSTSTPRPAWVHEEGQSARPVLRAANWLHLNRGKRAWTYVADFYALFLLFLAFSGLLMIPGKKRPLRARSDHRRLGRRGAHLVRRAVRRPLASARPNPRSTWVWGQRARHATHVPKPAARKRSARHGFGTDVFRIETSGLQPDAEQDQQNADRGARATQTKISNGFFPVRAT